MAKEKGASSPEAQIEELTKLNKELVNENTKLTAEISALKKDAQEQGLLPTVEHEGKSYRFAVPKFFVPSLGKKFTAEDAASNKDVVKELIAINSSVLIPLV
jgi:regulator of replication initiation timing